jgi:hypothetical protein
MGQTALDLNDDGLSVLVAHHHTLQNTLRHLLTLQLLGFGRATLRLGRSQTGDVAAQLAHPCRFFQLARCFLEAQVELLLLQFYDLVGKLIVA